MKILIQIIVMFALSFAQSHNIVPHSHEDEHSQEMQNEHESSHFEFSDEFTRFNLSGYNVTFAQFTKEFKNNFNFKIAYAFSIINIKQLPDSKPIHLHIRDNYGLYNSETAFFYTLRAPPFLIA